jgi:membrane associated rhomboid family serine protease
MARPSIFKPVIVSTLISGSLDIIFAMILTIAYGRTVPNMLRTVASGPFPEATGWGAGGALMGLLVHYSLMAIMALVFILIVRARPQLLETPLRTALAFGIVTYFVMNWLVVPLRFHTPLPPKPVSQATQLFAHVVLVGLVFTFVARRFRATDPE